MFFTHPVWCILLLVTLFNLQGTGAALADSFDRIAYLSLFVKHFFQVLANFFRFPILFGFSQPLPSRTAFLDYHPSVPLSRTSCEFLQFLEETVIPPVAKRFSSRGVVGIHHCRRKNAVLPNQKGSMQASCMLPHSDRVPQQIPRG